MLEDCADAREARDEALLQIESLEEEVELLESKFAGSDQTLKTLICLLVETKKKYNRLVSYASVSLPLRTSLRIRRKDVSL